MRPDILIVGQGLAGTLLAWEFECAGIPFAIAESGGAGAASRVAAGIINPITGRRLVKSAGVDEGLPLARATYRELEAALGVSLWREFRVRRLFADERERRVLVEKQARGELAPFAGAADAAGFWIEGAARVDLPALLDAARTRWQARGQWREMTASIADEATRHALVIDATGIAGARSSGSIRADSVPPGQARRSAFDFVPWEFSKGEILTLAVDGLAPDVVLNRGHWVLPLGPGMAAVGATHEPGVTDPAPTAAARGLLEASAAALLARPFTVIAHAAGVRVNLPDKRPVAGRHPADPRLGILNGLGAKGALLAPCLARQWTQQVATGAPFDAAVDVARFSTGHSSQAWSR